MGGLLCLFSCGGDSAGPGGDSANSLVPTVEAVQARSGTLPLIERLTGEVRADNQVGIFPETSAVIVAVYVRDGDQVKKGQPLVRLRDREFQERVRQAEAEYRVSLAQLKQVEARLKERRAELNRARSLAEEKLISVEELEAAETRVVSAEADVELAAARVEQQNAAVAESEEELSYTVVRAPVSGTVGSRNAEVGMLVSANTRLFTVGKLNRMKIEVVLTDRMLRYIRKGQRAEIFTEHLTSGGIQARLSRISPFLHPATHSTVGEIDLENPDGSLTPGMFVAVDVYYGESEEATLVPLSALYENPASGATGIFVSRETLNREPDTAEGAEGSFTLTRPISFTFREVDLIAKGRMHAGVGGVKPGNWVVTLGQNLLGGDSKEARVRPVSWKWVEKLQSLQRQDLLLDIMKQQREAAKKTGTGETP